MLVGCTGPRNTERAGETDALIRAARAGSPDGVRAILASPKVDVNGRDEHGNTALIEAARLGHDKVVTELLLAHADPTLKNDQGQTALMLATEGKHDDTARVLMEAQR